MNPNPDSFFPKLGLGLGLRAPHYREVLEGRSSVSWFEVISENFMGDGGRPIHILEKVRRDFPIVLHGVSLSVGSSDPIDFSYLRRLKNLVDQIQPSVVSDHCCWTSIDGENLHDLMPLPFTEEAVEHIVEKVKRAQDFLGRRILLENVSSYVTFQSSEMTEWDFLSEISNRSDCGLLLDVNNVYVSAVNHGFKALDFILGVPVSRVGQFHLAGHTTRKLGNGQSFLVDTHDHPVCPEVWDLYRAAVHRFGAVSTMIEWDAEIPAYAELEKEILKAKEIQNTTSEGTKHVQTILVRDSTGVPLSSAGRISGQSAVL
jgi:uncharacterized protein (UPF0276 family)